ncbi:peptide MFS transporter [Cellvibrio sp. pealriver]|uniref:peptide MFS transporter n=1 Tax=Cellvibrio sp. pealriver TaxID=1622269 RepID=UPI00066FB7A9|nr:oligopeptide:H+ symporter [Cellvibrio sp. pealriver]
MITNNNDFLGHPKGLYVCFATEMWERFSFYGMKYLLLLYLTKYHLFSDGAGLDILGAYAGLVYATPVIGGLIADRYLGTRRAVMLGAVILSVGHFLMAFEGQQAVHYPAGTVLVESLTLKTGEVLAAGTVLANEITIQDTAALNIFYLAIALIVVGVGFLKPNISVIVGQLYPANDPRRDSGFTLFYMGINVGSFIAILLCGWLGETYGWKYGFGLAGIGMVIGMLVFMYGQRYIKEYTESPCPEWLIEKRAGIKREWWIYLGSLCALPVIWWLVQSEPIVHITQNVFLLVGIVGILAYSMIHSAPWESKKSVMILAALVIVIGLGNVMTQNKVIQISEEGAELALYAAILALLGFVVYGFLRHRSAEFTRTLVLMVLTLSAIVFWSLIEQSAASMTLFADRVLDRDVFGTTVVASQFPALNPAFIMLLAIPLAFLWPWLDARGMNPSTPVKFSIGIIFSGLGFGALVLGAQFPNEVGKVAIIWMVLAYLLHSVGEMCLSPIGLSAVTKLSLPRVVSASMGIWFVATALSETLATRISKWAAIDPSAKTDVAAMLATYTELFEFLMWMGVGAGICLLIISPLLKRGMAGVR